MIRSMPTAFMDKEYADAMELAKVYKAINLTKDMQAEIDKYTKLKELAYADEIKTIKNVISTVMYTYAMEGARDYLEKDKDATESNRANFKYVKSTIEDNFIGDKIKIIKIVAYGYEGYDWEIKFEYHDKLFELVIPDLDKINIKNYEYSSKGKFSIGVCENEHSTTIFKSSYLESEIKEALKEFIYKENKDEKTDD